MKCLCIDFDDSFSFNIMSDLFLYHELKKEDFSFLPFKDVKNFDLEKLKDLDLLILGPGPGHVDEYFEGIKIILDYCQRVSTKVLGICLGHQLIMKFLGHEIIVSREIVHGQAVKLKINNFWKKILKKEDEVQVVQRYNSFAVKKKNTEYTELSIKEEVLAFIDENFLSYQFHPESVGTKNRKAFLYNAVNYHLEGRL